MTERLEVRVVTCSLGPHLLTLGSHDNQRPKLVN